MKNPPRKGAGAARGPRRLDGAVLDVAVVAALLGASEKCIRARVARNLLPHRRWSGRVVFLRDDIMTFLSKLDGCHVDEALANLRAREGGR